MKKLVAILSMLALVSVAGQALAADITYSGSAMIGTLILKAGAVSTFEAKTGIKFSKIDEPGSGKGLQALLADQVVLAGAGRHLKPEEKKQKLAGTTIGYDAIAIFVHKDNPVKNLSKEQLKGIFTGQIKNWKEVGGHDAPIAPITELLAGKRATVEMLHELVLDGAAFGPVKEIDQPRDHLVELAKNPNGLCGVSLGLPSSLSSEVQGKIKIVSLNGVMPNDKSIQTGSYLISRPMLLVTKGLPKDEVKDFITFILSAEGQAIVAKNFVPVRK